MPSISCAFQCDVEVTGTALTYPGHVSTVTVAIPTRRVDVYLYGDSSSVNRTVALTTELQAPITSTQAPPTWHFNSLTLYVFLFFLLIPS
jgi:hypothetical protein